jgi:cobalt-zinc-cadmium efflux system membrane fusion protein
VEEVGDLNLVTVAHPEQFPLVTVEMRKMREELRVNGVVAPDVNRTVPVNSLSSGRVLDIRARLGDFVKKGELLLTLHSSDVTLDFADLQKFRADELLARKSLERAQLLYSKGAIAQKDLQTAEDAEQKAKVDVQTALERVKILGGDRDHPSPMIEMRAPISGTVIEQNTTRGAGVKSLDNSPNLFTIADLSRVWILCDVYENSLTQVHLGDFGEVRLNAYPERVMKARVANIGRILDPATRTVKVRFELDNHDSLLRPGMFATVTFLSQSAQSRAVVPATAVIRLHDKEWVFASLGGNRFRRTEIQVGATTSDGFQEILSGVKAGDRVVALN